MCDTLCITHLLLCCLKLFLGLLKQSRASHFEYCGFVTKVMLKASSSASFWNSLFSRMIQISFQIFHQFYSIFWQLTLTMLMKMGWSLDGCLLASFKVCKAFSCGLNCAETKKHYTNLFKYSRPYYHQILFFQCTEPITKWVTLSCFEKNCKFQWQIVHKIVSYFGIEVEFYRFISLLTWSVYCEISMNSLTAFVLTLHMIIKKLSSLVCVSHLCHYIWNVKYRYTFSRKLSQLKRL